jgi:hypothetical protein
VEYKKIARRNQVMQPALIAISFQIYRETVFLMFLIYFSFCNLTLAGELEKDEFCNLEISESDLVDFTILKRTDKIGYCKKWKNNKKSSPLSVPVIFKNSLIKSAEVIYFDHEDTSLPGPLPGFIKFDNQKNNFELDMEEFLKLIESNFSYQGIMETVLAGAGKVSTDLTCDHQGQESSGYTLCTITYQNDKSEKKWIECYFSYYAYKKIGVAYRSSLFDMEVTNDINVYKNMTALFKSMRYRRIK